MGVLTKIGSFPGHNLAECVVLLGATIGGPATTSLKAEQPTPAAFASASFSPTALPPANALKIAPSYGKLTYAQQRLSQEVYRDLPSSARPYFIDLLERNVRATGKTALCDVDFLGGNTLETLAERMQQKMHPHLEKDRARIITDFLIELANPGEIDQKGRGACGASVLYHLYEEFPAEGARITSAMLSPEGYAYLRNSTATIERPRFWELPYAKPGQTMTEALSMGALLKLSVLPNEDYCSHCDKRFNRETGKISRGIESGQLVVQWNALFGTDRTEQLEVADSTVEKVFARIKDNIGGLTAASLRWSEREREVLGEVAHQLPNVHGAIEGDHLIGMEAVGREMRQNTHIVLVVDIRDDEVLFRNSSRKFTKRREGSVVRDEKSHSPTRKLVDAAAGIWSMSEEDFKDRLKRTTLLDTSFLRERVTLARKTD